MFLEHVRGPDHVPVPGESHSSLQQALSDPLLDDDIRGLAVPAPYFHNGSAATLEDVVDFYETRFGIGLTLPEKADLTAFLGAL